MAEIIRKSELAAELGLSKARISQLVKIGLPVRSDGRLDRAQALAWLKKYTSSSSGGWHRRGKENTSDVAGKLLGESPREFSADEIAAFRMLLDRLCIGASRIPELLLQAGLKDIDMAVAAPEAFRDLVFVLAGDDITDFTYDWFAGDDVPTVHDPSPAKLARRFGQPKPVAERSEAMLDALAAVLYPPTPSPKVEVPGGMCTEGER
jgi:hypothetical protein